MKRKYVVLLSIIGIIATGILIGALAGVLPASDLPFAFGVLAVLGVLLLGYITLRVRDE